MSKTETTAQEFVIAYPDGSKVHMELDAPLPLNEALIAAGDIGDAEFYYLEAGAAEYVLLDSKALRDEAKAFWHDTIEKEKHAPPVDKREGDHYLKKWDEHKEEKLEKENTK